MTVRGGSPDSDDSILSHITVLERDSATPPAVATMSAVSRSSVGASSLQSTPPTSLDGSTVDMVASKDSKKRRASRARSSLSTLTPEDGQQIKRKVSGRVKSVSQSIATSRTVSGATLVETSAGSNEMQNKLLKELDIDMHFDVPDGERGVDNTGAIRRRVSRRSQIGHLAQEATSALGASASSLGKRARDTIEHVKDKASNATTRAMRTHSVRSPAKKPKLEIAGRIFPKLARTASKEEEEEQEQHKEDASKPKREPRVQKKYQTKGLFAGQTRNFNAMVKETTNKKKSAATPNPAEERENSILPLPMFGAYKRLTIKEDEGWANYRLPADILRPLAKEQNPKDWSRLNKNRFIGDAAATWDAKAWKRIDTSYCGCKEKCDDDCMNRASSWECNEKICALGPECGNRPFAELAFRYKNKNFTRLRGGDKPEANLWGEGIETQRTEGRGFGVRAMRPFKPDQIVVEYCGEIITQEEADRRMNTDYKDKKDYYLMDFHDGMIIDATRGSICRFVNHSCDPNCRVEKWIVNGEPRMALFAGEDGLMTGEELTYDYNFEVFSQNSKQQCLCGSENCRGFLGPKPKERQSKAKQFAGVVKGALQGVKRKVEQVLIGEQDENEVEKKRVKMDPKALVNKVRRQITSSNAPAVSTPDPKIAQANKQDRAKRAAERQTRETADLETHRMKQESHDAEQVQPDKVRRRSTLTTVAITDLPKVTAKTSDAPARRVPSIKKRITDAADSIKAAVSSTPTVRNVSSTSLIKSSESSVASTEPRGMRQSRLSFGPGSFGFNMSPKKEDKDEMTKVLTVPARISSLKTRTVSSHARPGTAKSIIKGASKMAAVAKIGAGGEKAMRNTIRTVSGTE